MGQTTEFKVGQISHTPAEEGFGGFHPPHGGRAKRGFSRKRKAWLLILGAVVLVALVVGGIAWSDRDLVTVQTAKVTRQSVSAIVTASGEIKPPPNMFATVNANSFGKVTEILVKEGEHVEKGQLLMRTEDVQQEADVHAQEAALSSARADAEVQKAAVQSATANLQTAQANLSQAQAKFKQSKDDFARGQQMFNEELIARQVFDQDLSNYQVAGAAVESAKAQIAQAKAQLNQAVYNRDMSHARVLQAQAQLVGIENQRDQTIYTAPFSGVITSLPVHVGENVVPGIQNQVGSVLFQVSNLSVINAVVDVDESDILAVKNGQPAEVSIDAIPGKRFKGRVTEVGMSAISSNSGQTTSSSSAVNTGEAKDFEVYVTLDNPPPGLRPGLSTTAKITTATVNDAVTIPIQALTVREEGELEREKEAGEKGKAVAAEPSTTGQNANSKKEIQGVFVVKSGRAVFTPVKTGIMGTMNVQTLSGLKPGEEIVSGSYQVLRTLKNNTRVKVDNNITNLGQTSSL